jgi:hypothetical protein
MYLHRITTRNTRRVSNSFAVGVVCTLTVAAAGSSIGSPMAQQTATELTDTLTLNLALLTSSNAIRLLVSPTSPIELHLPPATTSKDPRATRHSLEHETRIAPPAAPSPITISPSVPVRDTAELSADWAHEAQAVAAASTSGSGFRSFGHRPQSESSPPSKSIFADHPTHHAGEQFIADDGRWAVFVSDDCYHTSDPFASPNPLEHGMGVQTYCVRKS